MTVASTVQGGKAGWFYQQWIEEEMHESERHD